MHVCVCVCAPARLAGGGGRKEAIQINLRLSGLMSSFEYVQGKVGRTSLATASSVFPLEFYSPGRSTCCVSRSVPGTQGDLADNTLALELRPLFLWLWEALREQSSLEASSSFLQLTSQGGSFGKQIRRKRTQ